MKYIEKEREGEREKEREKDLLQRQNNTEKDTRAKNKCMFKRDIRQLLKH